MTNHDKAKELHDQLMHSVTMLVTSDDWQAALQFAAKFHRYSFGNQLLIARQKPDAMRVAGFNTWKKLGRHVKAGETGLRILAPITVKKENDDGTESRVLRWFKVVSVFDVSQTEGADLPEEVRYPSLLGGEGSAWDDLARLVEAEGFTVERGPCFGANGFTDYAARVVRVRDDVTPMQATKTLAHELGHVLLHEGERFECRGVKEVEAESVAYVVCAALGFETGDYSLPYVAGWSDGKVEVVKATGERVVATARKVLDALEQASERELVLA